MEERIKRLEDMVLALMKKVEDIRLYAEADIIGARQNLNENSGDIEVNTSDISDVRTAIEEVYEMLEEE